MSDDFDRHHISVPNPHRSIVEITSETEQLFKPLVDLLPKYQSVLDRGHALDVIESTMSTEKKYLESVLHNRIIITVRILASIIKRIGGEKLVPKRFEDFMDAQQKAEEAYKALKRSYTELGQKQSALFGEYEAVREEIQRVSAQVRKDMHEIGYFIN
jgi:hypothetical protein